jgi:hypothetical protein
MNECCCIVPCRGLPSSDPLPITVDVQQMAHRPYRDMRPRFLKVGTSSLIGWLHPRIQVLLYMLLDTGDTRSVIWSACVWCVFLCELVFELYRWTKKCRKSERELQFNCLTYSSETSCVFSQPFIWCSPFLVTSPPPIPHLVEDFHEVTMSRNVFLYYSKL